MCGVGGLGADAGSATMINGSRVLRERRKGEKGIRSPPPNQRVVVGGTPSLLELLREEKNIEMKHDISKEIFCIAASTNLRNFQPN